MKLRRKLGEPDEPIELNLIPLIDVIMFLLIFFISTTSLMEEAGLSVDKPQAGGAVQSESKSIVFAITSDGKVAYAGKEIGINGVRPTKEVPGPVTKRLIHAWSDMVGLDIVAQALNHLDAGERDRLLKEWRAKSAA